MKRSIMFRFLLSIFIFSNTTEACVRLANNTWDELVNELDKAQSRGDEFIFFCPFLIIGEEACPGPDEEGYLFNAFAFHIICARWRGPTGDGCIIDCPMRKNHFKIEPFSLITMETFTLRGALQSSIHVQAFATFKSIGTKFEYNGFEWSADDRSGVDPGSALSSASVISSGGAAVLIEESGLADLEQCTFIGNRAILGGAIQSMGDVQVHGGRFESNIAANGGAIHSVGYASVFEAMFHQNKAILKRGERSLSGNGGSIHMENYIELNGCTFEENHADNDGGGLHHGGGLADLRYCLWMSNTAGRNGPAVSVNDSEGQGGQSDSGTESQSRPGQVPGSEVFQVGNGGCGNIVETQQDAVCTDGVSGRNPGSCYEFDFICTSAPSTTLRPSAIPSRSPSHKPSISLVPSRAPSPVPTIAPSIEPSVGPTHSKGPSIHPSIHPSFSLFPSNRPSIQPSESPNPSKEPTIEPSESSIEPSTSSIPSIFPPTRLPTQSPSALPTKLPSIEPSQ